jgi:hypothetical protein
MPQLVTILQVITTITPAPIPDAPVVYEGDFLDDDFAVIDFD